MRQIKFVLALLSAFATAVVPIAPAAAETAPGDTRAAIAQHAAQGNALILTPQQVDRLAQVNPSLHSKVMDAYYGNQIPNLSAGEKAQLTKLTRSNLKAFKAGVDPGTLSIAGATGFAAFGVAGFLVLGLIGVVIVLILMQAFGFGFFGRVSQNTSIARAVA